MTKQPESQQRVSTAAVAPVRRRSDSHALGWLLRLLTATGLGIDAYIHWHLAPDFDTLAGPGHPVITGGQLFRVEAALAAMAMLLVILLSARAVAAVAFLVAAGGVAAVLVYQYTDPGTIGPLPDMHDPVWSTAKTTSAVAEVIAAAAAMILLGLLTRNRAHRRPQPVAGQT